VDSQVRVVVNDQGIGIPADALERVFEKFERAVSDRNYGGLGLGLWLTREIVQAMGGSVRAENDGAKGARFVVTMPHRS
jgi:signal transduction histidine kinase